MANVSLLSCSQEKKSTNYKQEEPMYDINQYIYPEAKDVTEANFVEKVSK